MDNINWDRDLDKQDTSKLEPKDFLFDVTLTEDGLLSIIICPKKYFAKYGYCYDNHLGDIVENWLPTYLDEAMECEWVCGDDSKTPEDIRRALLFAGFQEDAAFTQFLKNCAIEQEGWNGDFPEEDDDY